MSNTHRNTNQFFNINYQTPVNQSSNNVDNRTIIGKYRSEPNNIAFPVNSSSFPLGKSPYEQLVVIEKQENSLIWGTIYIKPVSETKWIKAAFTGSVNNSGVIKIVTDSKNAGKLENNTNLALLITLVPLASSSAYPSTQYKLTAEIVGKGITFTTKIYKLSKDAQVDIND